MLIIDSWLALALALQRPLDAGLRKLLILRRSQISTADRLAETARFIVVRPTDSVATIEAAIGFPLIGKDGSPSWEWIERHPSGLIEAAFVFTDDGPTDVLLMPNVHGLDADLVDLLQHHAADEFDRQQTDLS